MFMLRRLKEAAVGGSSAAGVSSLSGKNVGSCGRLLSRFGRRGKGKGQLNTPCGVAVTKAGDVVVVDSENNRVQVFTTDGRLKCVIGQKGSLPHQLNHPLCVCVTKDPHERLLVTDSVSAAVKVFDLDGKFLTHYGQSGLFDFPYGIALTSDQHIVVTDICRHSVQVLYPSGCRRNQFGQYGDGLTDLDHPYFVAVNQTDDIIVCDTGNSCVKVFTLNGVLLHKFTIHDFKLYQEDYILLQGLIVDEANNVVVIGNCTVFIMDRNGRLWEVLYPDDGLHSPRCLASHSSGVLVVSQGGYDNNHEVCVFRYHPEYYQSLRSIPVSKPRASRAPLSHQQHEAVTLPKKTTAKEAVKPTRPSSIACAQPSLSG